MLQYNFLKCTGQEGLKISQYSQKSTCVVSLSLMKLQDWRPLSKETLTPVFSHIQIVKFLRTPILKNIRERLLLKKCCSKKFRKTSYENTCDRILFKWCYKPWPATLLVLMIIKHFIYFNIVKIKSWFSIVK